MPVDALEDDEEIQGQPGDPEPEQSCSEGWHWWREVWVQTDKTLLLYPPGRRPPKKRRPRAGSYKTWVCKRCGVSETFV